MDALLNLENFSEKNSYDDNSMYAAGPNESLLKSELIKVQNKEIFDAQFKLDFLDYFFHFTVFLSKSYEIALLRRTALCLK